ANVFGFTDKSTLVTLNGVGVREGVGDGVGLAVAVVEPEPFDPLPPPLLPHATKTKASRQMNTIPSNGRLKVFLCIGCFNIAFLLRGILKTVKNSPLKKYNT